MDAVKNNHIHTFVMAAHFDDGVDVISDDSEDDKDLTCSSKVAFSFIEVCLMFCFF